MAKQNIFMIAAVIVGIAFVGGYLTPATAPTGAVQGEPAVVEPVGDGIFRQQTVTSTTVSLIPQDFYNPGATLDIEGAIFRNFVANSDKRIIGNGNITFDSGALSTGTFSANPGEFVTIYLGDNDQTTGIDGSTTVALDSTNNWYCDVIIGKEIVNGAGNIVPNLDIGTKCYKADTRSAPYTDGLFWIQNPNGTVNTSSAQWNLGASEEGCTTMTLKGPSEKAFGNPFAQDKQGIVVAFDYNTTLYSKVYISSSDAVPTTIPSTVTGTADIAYELNFSSLKNNEERKISVCAKTASHSPATGEDINGWFFDPDVYFDEEGDGLKWGVVDSEDSIDLGWPSGPVTAPDINVLVYVS